MKGKKKQKQKQKQKPLHKLYKTVPHWWTHKTDFNNYDDIDL